eukprot:jgi/Picre1/29935/NNA_005313.t1
MGKSPYLKHSEYTYYGESSQDERSHWHINPGKGAEGCRGGGGVLYGSVKLGYLKSVAASNAKKAAKK